MAATRLERSVRLTLALAIGCAGCAQLFGIEDTTHSGASTRLDLQRVSIGASVTTAPLDLGTGAPAYLVPSADPTGVTQVAATLAMPGEWTAHASGQVGLYYTVPDRKPVTEALAFGDTTTANHVAFEHPNPDPAPASTLMLDVMLPGAYAGTQTLEVAAIGAWTTHTLSGTELPALNDTTVAAALDYSKFAPITPAAPARITTADQLVVLRYSGPTLTGQLIAARFDQSTTTDTITGTMAPVSPITPFNVAIDLVAAGTRLDAEMPKGTASSAQWLLDSAPGAAYGSTYGVQLDGGALVMTDKMITGSYANPFASLAWQPLLTYAAFSTRTYMVGGIPVTLVGEIAAIGDPTTTSFVDIPVGVPTSIALAQKPLVTDGMIAAVDPATALDLDIITDTPSNTLYAVTVVEYAVVASTVTQNAVISLATLDPHVTLPPGILQNGHTYAVIASAVQGGYPNAAGGDLTTFALPIWYGIATSAVFTVAAP